MPGSRIRGRGSHAAIVRLPIPKAIPILLTGGFQWGNAGMALARSAGPRVRSSRNYDDVWMPKAASILPKPADTPLRPAKPTLTSFGFQSRWGNVIPRLGAFCPDSLPKSKHEVVSP